MSMGTLRMRRSLSSRRTASMSRVECNNRSLELAGSGLRDTGHDAFVVAPDAGDSVGRRRYDLGSTVRDTGQRFRGSDRLSPRVFGRVAAAIA